MTKESNMADRSAAQFFFEVGFGASWAEAFVALNVAPFPLTDQKVERAWEIAGEAHDDRAEFDRMLALANGAGWHCVERSPDADCGCPEEFWERAGSPAVHMHLNAGKVSNGHADNGDWETEIEVKCETVDQARAAILGWASSLTDAPQRAGLTRSGDGA